MNHDYVHCSDCTDDCPENCFRAQLTRDLEKINDYNLWITWAHLKGIGECLNPYNETTGKKEKQKMDKYNDIINLKFTKAEGTTLGQILMEAISKRTYEPDNVNVEWLWGVMEALAEKMQEHEEDE